MACNFRIIVLTLIVAVAAWAFADQKEDWATLTAQELQMKEVPGDPGASAIQLYYAQYIDNSNSSQFVHQCIRILNEKGRQYADVEIMSGLGIGVKDLKARTIHPDGSIVEFTGKPFEKTLFKSRGVKLLVKTFTMPDVTVGSIVEYKYTLTSYSGDEWDIQHDLFTARENFKFIPGKLYGFLGANSRIAWITLHSRDIQIKQVKGNRAELEMHNVPAFVSESSMPPEDNYKMSVRFFYLPGEINTVDKYWDLLAKAAYTVIDESLGNHKEIKEAALQAIGSETDPEKKLRLLYARVQQVRNLTYERERTEQEMKKEKLKENSGVKEVLKRGYGEQDDITELFVAMARAAGFDVSILLVSNRSERFFEKEVLSYRQLDSLVADVKLNGKDIYLDPGTKYCPFGLLPWWRTNTAALRPDKKAGSFVAIPGFGYDKAQTRRIADVSLDENGNLKGELLVEFHDLEALEHRLDLYDKDKAGQEEDLVDEVLTWLPGGALAKVKDVHDWEDSAKPLVVTLNIEIPAYAAVAGKRLLMPASLFQLKQEGAFTHAERKYPLYFPYAFSEFDTVKFRLPSGYTPENVPPQQDAALPYATYRSLSQLSEGQLVNQRVLLFNVIFSDVPKFPEIKAFFNKVQAGDEQQAVLKAGGSIDAQKTH